MRYKKIGILGGMGPEATAALYLKIIKIFQQEYGAKYDADFPEMVILNLPLSDVVEKIGQEKEIETQLIRGVKLLENAGVDLIAVPCNTVMFFLSAMQQAVSVPILSILQETADEVGRKGLKTVGILGTEMTLRSGIYKEALGKVTAIIPDAEERKEVTRIVMSILSGKKSKKDQELLRKIITAMKVLGAEKVILGCTELPLLIENADTIDTLEVLAKAIVREAINNGGIRYEKNNN